MASTANKLVISAAVVAAALAGFAWIQVLRSDPGGTERDGAMERSGSGSGSSSAPGASRSRAIQGSDSAAPGPSENLRIRELEGRVAELEAELAMTRLKLEKAEQSKGPFDVPYVDLSNEDLVELAKRCDVRTDLPYPLDEEGAADLGLSAAEVAAWERAWKRFETDDLEILADLVEELPGDHPDTIDWADMHRRFLALADQVEAGRLRQKMSRERAGLDEPPSDLAALSLHERWWRAFVDRGNAFEEALGKELGPDRAHELRVAGNGWPGQRRMRVVGCPAEPED